MKKKKVDILENLDELDKLLIDILAIGDPITLSGFNSGFIDVLSTMVKPDDWKRAIELYKTIYDSNIKSELTDNEKQEVATILRENCPKWKIEQII